NLPQRLYLLSDGIGSKRGRFPTNSGHSRRRAAVVRRQERACVDVTTFVCALNSWGTSGIVLSRLSNGTCHSACICCPMASGPNEGGSPRIQDTREGGLRWFAVRSVRALM